MFLNFTTTKKVIRYGVGGEGGGLSQIQYKLFLKNESPVFGGDFPYMYIIFIIHKFNEKCYIYCVK